MATGSGVGDAAGHGAVLRLVREALGSRNESVHRGHRVCGSRPHPLERAKPASWWQRWEGRVRFAVWFALYLTAIGLVASLLGYIITAPALAHGQSLPTSLPASQPATGGWFVANWPQLALGIGWLLSNLATMLGEYPDAKDATTRLAKMIRMIRLLGALVSVVHFSNTGGKGLTFKFVGQPITPAKLNPPA